MGLWSRAKVALSNLEHCVERCYYRHGFFCSSHPVIIIAFTCTTIIIMSIALLTSPVVHGNALIEWRSSDVSHTPVWDINSIVRPQWLKNPPSAAVQHIMLQFDYPTPFEAMRTLFKVNDLLQSLVITTEEGEVKMSDICYHVKGSSGSTPLPSSGCLFLTPTLLWDNDLVTLLSDPDITTTILTDAAVGSSSTPVLRDLLFGSSWTMHPHPIILTLFLNPALPSVPAVIEALISHLSHNYSVSTLSEKEFKSDYAFLNKEKADEGPFSSNQEKIHVFFSDRVNLVELIPLSILYVLVFLYIVFSVQKITLVKSKVGLACVAVLTIVFSFIMSLGFCAHFNLLRTVTAGDIFPYIFTLVGLENVLTITRSVTITPGDQDVNHRIAQGLSTEGVKITKNFIALTALFLTGIFTPVPSSFQEFCMVALVCVIADFYLQLCFFVPVLSLDIRRLELSETVSPPAKVVEEQPRKTKIFRHNTIHKVVLLTTILYGCYVIYHSITSSRADTKSRNVSHMLAVGSTKLLQWFISQETMGQKQDKKSSYEEMFPVYAQPFAVPEPVDLFDQSWRRVARDDWPYLFNYYNTTITGRYFDVLKPIYVEPKVKREASDRDRRISYQSQVKQWLQMPVTLHFISTLLGLVVFLPIAGIIFLCFNGLLHLCNTNSAIMSRTGEGSPVLEVPYIYNQHSAEIECVASYQGDVLSTSIDGDIRLWSVRDGKTRLQITSESVPWCCALHADYAALGNSDGTLNIVHTVQGTVTTLQSHTQGVAGLHFNSIGLLLIWYIDGLIEVAELTASPDVTMAERNVTMTTMSSSHLYPVTMSCYNVTDTALYSTASSNMVKMHSLRDLSQLHVYPCPAKVTALCVADSTLYTGDCAGTVCVWKAHQLQGELSAQRGSITHLAHNTEHLIALSADHTVVIWDRDNLTLVSTLQVGALDIAVIEMDYLLILQKSDILLWSLEDQGYHDQMDLSPHFAGSSSNSALHSSAQAVVIINDRKIIPVRTIRSM